MARSFLNIRIRRSILSAGIDLLILLGIIASLINSWYALPQVCNSMYTYIIIFLILGTLYLAKQSYARYIEITYDPTWALKYQDRFTSKNVLKNRVYAARCIIDNQSSLTEMDKLGDKIDWVLFYLEDIGFYVKGLKISPEVAYHHFYYWIRGYYLWTRPYIEAWQSKPHEKTRWEYIKISL